MSDAILIVATVVFLVMMVSWALLPASGKSTETPFELGSIGDEIREPVAVGQ